MTLESKSEMGYFDLKYPAYILLGSPVYNILYLSLIFMLFLFLFLHRCLLYFLQDLKPYMNPCPYTVYPNTPVPQVFNLFRSMGLRHLPVVSHDGQVST